MPRMIRPGFGPMLGGSGPGFGPILGVRAWIWAYFGESFLDLGLFWVPSLDLGLFWRIRPGFGPILEGPDLAEQKAMTPYHIMIQHGPLRRYSSTHQV